MNASLSDYYRLCKPGIVRMVMITAGIGYVMPVRGFPHSLTHFILSLVGIGLATAGSTVLNNFLERDIDGLMDRTRHRELPTGRIDPAHALAFGVVLTFAGLGILVSWVNMTTAFTVLLSSFLYVVVYTPLKRRTWLNTSIGAIPGALPISCGWIAATGHFDLGAWLLFGLMFAWQHPHFYAIAWMYRDDYRKAGFKMLSVVDESGVRLFIQVILYAFLLLALSLAPGIIGTSGAVYISAALLLGIYIIVASLRFVRHHTYAEARRLLFSTIIYLPLLGVAVLADIAVRPFLV